MTFAVGRTYDAHGNLDAEVAVAAVTYVAERLPRPTSRSVFAVLYEAEKRHLSEYLVPIVGDRYVAVASGPVPAHLHDLLLHLRDPSAVLGVDPELAAFGRRHLRVRERRHVEVRTSCDLDALSASAIECLDEAIDRAPAKRGGQREAATDDPAWRSTPRNASLSWRAIAATLPDGSRIVDHLDDPFPG